MLTYDEIADLLEEAELELISSLQRSIAGHKALEQDEGFEWSAWQANKLRSIERFRRENRQIMAHYRGVIDSSTRQLMVEQFAEGAGVQPPNGIPDRHFFGVNADKMDSLITDITQLEQRAESAALRTMDDVYRQTLYRAQLAMSTDSVPLEKAIDMAVRDFLNQGINCIVYRDGRHVNIADYVRMALRTTAVRASLQGKAKKYAELGFDTVIVSQYSMCSDTCLPWQGRVYIDDVFVPWEGEKSGDMGKSNYCGKWFPLLSVALRGGLFHPNCRHSFELWQEGKSKMPEPIDPKTCADRYKAEQKQRALERQVRKCKRLVLGLSDPAAVRQAKADLQKALQKLDTHVQAHGGYLRREYGREKVYDTAIQSAAIPAAETVQNQTEQQRNTPQPAETQLKNRVDNSAESGIIELGKRYLESKPRLERHEIEDCYNTVNPKYGTSQAYADNCQRCVATYEARRRGYDVTALPCNDPKNDSLVRMQHIFGWANVFKDGLEALEKMSGSNAEAVLKNITARMNEYGDGSRAIIRVKWKKSTDGHVFNVEQKNGKLVFIDSQYSFLDVNYIDDEFIIIDETWILRVDDKEFSDLAIECFE